MNKKLICLLLSLVMLMGCLVGCSNNTKKDERPNDKNVDLAKTISMYMLSEQPVSEKQEAELEDAVNAITKSKFKTAVDLRFYTAEEYYDKLEKAFADYDEAFEQGLIGNEEEATGDKTFINDLGMTEVIYPTASDYQVDIFYVGGLEKFTQYLDESRFARLDEEVSGASKILNDYLSTNYLKYMKAVDSSIYAIPTNNCIGEYTCLLLKKDVLEKTRYNTKEGLKEFTSLTCEAVQNMLRVTKNEYANYVPLYSCMGEDGIVLDGIRYWGVDENGKLSDDFSILMSAFDKKAVYGEEESYMAAIVNGLRNSEFNAQFKTLKGYKANGYHGTEKDLVDGKVAVAYVKGGAELLDKYGDDYEVVVIDKPTLTTDALYENLFAVSSSSVVPDRCMEVLCYLNTNPEFRNLLLYGIEGKDYELVNSEYLDANEQPYKVVRRLESDYMMDPAKTGNMVLAYALEGEDPRFADLIKRQNYDSDVDIAMGFSLIYGGYTVNAEKLQDIRTMSIDLKKKLDAINFDNFDEEYAAIVESYTGNLTISAVLSRLDPDIDQPCSLAYLYCKWAEDMGLYDPNAEE